MQLEGQFIFVYVMSRFFIRFTDSMKRISEMVSIHARLKIRRLLLRFARVRARVMLTTCVSGSAVSARYWRGSGSSFSGKNVPLKRNIGVMNRNVG